MAEIIAFHYDAWDNFYSDGTRATAAQRGRIYSDTTSAEAAEYGTITSSTANGQTTYTWTPLREGSVDVLIVAGGGTGGNSRTAGAIYENGGGGGGGGVVLASASFTTPIAQTIIVGQGGVIPSGNGQNKGYNSSAFGYTALGGGGGSTRDSQTNISGGSGGGAVNWSPHLTVGAGEQSYSASGGYGMSGGYAFQVASTDGGSAGGGGAGRQGYSPDATSGGNGGDGVCMRHIFGFGYGQSGIFGGGGGGGAGYIPGAGGRGGGGAGASRIYNILNGSNGRAHSGGGGGGNFADSGYAGNGGSGIVLVKIRYYPRPVKSGLVGWYTGDSAQVTSGSVTAWNDISGNGNHATVIRGAPKVKTDGTVAKTGFKGHPTSLPTDNQTVNTISFPVVYGTTADGIRFPDFDTVYTLFHVSRYYRADGSAPTRGRIFDGVGTNWLSGFWYGHSGVAFHDAWLTSYSIDYHGNDWVLSTDQRNLYRSNGINRMPASVTGSRTQMSINYGVYTSTTASESSDWAVAEVLIYNNEMLKENYLKVEAYLKAKYFDYWTIPPGGEVAGSFINAVYYGGKESSAGGKGYPLSLSRLAARSGLTSYGSTFSYSTLKGIEYPLIDNGGALDNISEGSRAPDAHYKGASGAYALRRLYGRYTGPQVRIKRSADNLETDLYFDKNGYIRNIDVDTWLDGSTGYAVTWYDQGPRGNDMDAVGTSSTTYPYLYKEAANNYVFYFPGSSPTVGGYFNSGNFKVDLVLYGEAGICTFSRVNFGGTDNWERVFDFANGPANNNFLLTRAGSNASILRHEMWRNNIVGYTQDTASITNNTWHHIGTRLFYQSSEWWADTWVDANTYRTDEGISSEFLYFRDRTITNSYIGRSNWSGDNYSNMKLSALIILTGSIMTIPSFGDLKAAFP